MMWNSWWNDPTGKAYSDMQEQLARESRYNEEKRKKELKKKDWHQIDDIPNKEEENGNRVGES